MKRFFKLILPLLMTLTVNPSLSFAQECMIGEVKWFAGNFAPRSWAKANGQLLPIAQNSALFSILGTTYGGDGETTFALPDLRGRSVIGEGRGNGLQERRLGHQVGTETNSLTVAQLPSHSHALIADKNAAVNSAPEGKLLSQSGTYRPESTLKQDVELSSRSIGHTGGGQPVNNMQPSLALTPIICIYGIYPSYN